MGILERMGKRKSIKNVSKGFIANIGRISQLVAGGKRNEEEVRRWCIDVLKSAMGYKDSEIETELKIMGRRVDIALKRDDKVFLVIECKAANVKLNDAAVNQAASYAVGLGSEWAAVTNGHSWKLYHVTPTKGIEPEIVELFDVSILDDDGISDDDAFNLYLLTAKAIFSGDTIELFHEINCLSFERLIEAVKTEEVSKLISLKIRESYKRNMGVSVNVGQEEVASYMEEILGAVSEAMSKK